MAPSFSRATSTWSSMDVRTSDQTVFAITSAGCDGGRRWALRRLLGARLHPRLCQRVRIAGHGREPSGHDRLPTQWLLSRPERWNCDGTLAIADVFSRRIVFNCTRYHLTTFPEFQAFRAIDLVDRLGYALDDDVKDFVVQTLRTAGIERFVQRVRAHRPELTDDNLRQRYQRYARP